MAVRHGYGKIEGTDALVFAYDTGDTVNSYKGEPTTNIHPEPQLNNWGIRNAQLTYTDDYVEIHTTSSDNYSGILDNLDVVSGSTYTMSYYYMHISGTPTIGGHVNTSTATIKIDRGTTVNNTITTVPDDGQYHLVEQTFTATTSGNLSYYIQPGRGLSEDVVGRVRRGDKYGVQFEEKDHATTFTEGTRSTTQSLYNLATNSSINTNTLSFDEQSEPYFDGTDDGIGIGQTASDIGIEHEFTFEYMVYFESSSFNDAGGGIGFPGYNPYWGYAGRFNLANSGTQVRPSIRYQNSSGGWVDSTSLNSTFNFDTYTHVVTVKGDGYLSHYIDGESAGTMSVADSGYNSTINTFVIGYTGWSRLSGKLPIIKAYNRALTAAEVKNNYRHYKNRFGI